MGLFKKKKRTTTETITETIIEHKIIKLTYLQSLAIAGGIGDVKDVAGETEGFTEENVDVKELKRGRADRHLQTFRENVPSWLKFVPGAGGQLARGAEALGSVGKALFGKKVSQSVTASVDDKGWRVVKSWLQPEFDKIRYALGIRELTVAQFRYEKVSEVISKPWASPKDITKVSLIVDQFIPPQFPPSQDYIQFYIKPELPHSDWIRINPIDNRTVYDSTGKIVPRIINFNTERSATARLEDAFVTTEQEVRQMRFRAVLNRPDSIPGSDTPADGYTPILKSYRMLLHPRGGL